MVKRSLEEKKEIVDQVVNLTKSGMSILSALKQCGISDATYYKWRQHIGANKKIKLKKQVQLFELPIENKSIPETKQNIALFIGNALDIKKIYDGIFGGLQ